MDEVPTVGSDNLIKSGGVADSINQLSSKSVICEEGETLLSFGDKENNDILEVYKDSYTKEIHVKTKDFDSLDKYTESFKGITSSGALANLKPGETYFNSATVNEFFRTFEGKKYYHYAVSYAKNYRRRFVILEKIVYFCETIIMIKDYGKTV